MPKRCKNIKIQFYALFLILTFVHTLITFILIFLFFQLMDNLVLIFFFEIKKFQDMNEFLPSLYYPIFL